MKWISGVIIGLFACSVSLAQTRTLDHYIDMAKSNSPLLKDLRNQVASNQLDSLRLKAGYKPQVNATTGGLYAPTINGFGYSSAITNEHTLNGLVAVNQQIIGKNNLAAQLAGITLQSSSTLNTLKISEQDLKKAVTAQYITTYGDQQQLNFNKEIVDLLRTEEELFKKLTQNNVYHQSDYLTFLVTLKQQELQLSQARLQYKNDYATLNYLSGVADTTTADSLVYPGLQRMIALPDNRSSIYFAQYKLDSLRIVNSHQQLDYSYKPKTNIFADGGYNSDFMGQAWKNFGVSAGFSLTIPLYDGGQRKMQHKKLSLEEETRENYKAFFDIQYRQQIAQLNQQISENEKLLPQINDQIKFSKALIKVDTKLLETGDVKIADLILAINNYLAVRNLKMQTEISKLQLINQLNYWNK
ncbi:TolC family protein [Mucilaginibacter ginsenosidivorans]|uniref:TolC family protein n=1 Tax=Mucilaginibacter ginsenosidivorans TaxID=398053 RepID=A0A5B8UVX8_9SPHI|nr:TolC family protein [Mucilaginibacter ginsenosidivorans]QEC63224.1 TolC family protein [Mucilaginibacter ginsenosidivorans]